jgi:hypothetical protein
VASASDFAPRPEAAPRTDTAASVGAAPMSAAPAPRSEPAPLPRPAEPSQAAAGTDNKYVVWSSAPSDVPRSGPDDR